MIAIKFSKQSPSEVSFMWAQRLTEMKRLQPGTMRVRKTWYELEHGPYLSGRAKCEDTADQRQTLAQQGF